MAVSPAIGNAPYETLLHSYRSFHIVLVITGSLFTVGLLAIGAMVATRWHSLHAAGRRFASFNCAALSLCCVLVGLGLALVVVANVTTVLHPAGGLGFTSTAAGLPQDHRSDVLATAFNDWIRSGRQEVPPGIGHAIAARLAWQRPKAIIASALLPLLVGTTWLGWSRLYPRARPSQSSVGRLVATAGAGWLGVAACLFVMLVVLGCTQAAVAPMSLTLAYG